MFGFLFRKKKEAVRRLLAGRMTTRYYSQFRFGKRQNPRGALCEVVWVMPYDSDRVRPVVEKAFPAVTKDFSAEGPSLIHTRPLPHRRIVIGLEGTVETHLLLAHVEHCTPLGYGFFQIGVHPEEVLRVLPEDSKTLAQRMRSFVVREDEERGRAVTEAEPLTVG